MKENPKYYNMSTFGLENTRILTDYVQNTAQEEPVVSLRDNRLKFETSGELPIILEESIKYTSNE